MVEDYQDIGFTRLGGRKGGIGAVVEGLSIYPVGASHNQDEKEAQQEGKQYVLLPE